MNIKEKIYKLGLEALDELLLHRNISKKVELTITEAGILSDMIVSVNVHSSFVFNEDEIAEFYQEWAKVQKRRRTQKNFRALTE